MSNSEKITRELVRHLHRDVDKALTEIAENYGLIYQPTSMRFTSWQITARLKLTHIEQAADRGIGAGKIVIGDRVKTGGEVFQVVDVTSRGNVIGVRDGDDKRFRLRPKYLTKVAK